MNGNVNVLTWSVPVKQGPFNLHPMNALLRVATPSFTDSSIYSFEG